jgi:hypothetical protein
MRRLRSAATLTFWCILALVLASCSTLAKIPEAVMSGIDGAQQNRTGRKIPLPPTVHDFEDENPLSPPAVGD